MAGVATGTVRTASAGMATDLAAAVVVAVLPAWAIPELA
jgi:hypothetical protein